MASRPSCDLFECIEQAPHKRLSEEQARYIFAQVVETVYYLDSLGITHRDIKDENLVIDKELKVTVLVTLTAFSTDSNLSLGQTH
jgi:serine/threonine protein kinase